MEFNKLIQQTLLIAALTLLIFGCSGGSSRPSNLQGVFGTTPVMGLAFVTPTQAGTTDAQGRFGYAPGEVVQFYLGEQLLGSAPGATNITEFDIAGLSQVPQNHFEWAAYYELRDSRSALSKAANIGGLLQTLDTDSNLGNNIQISGEVSALVTADLIDLYQQPWGFRNDRRTRKLLYRANLTAGLSPRPLRTGALALESMLPFDSIDQFQRYELDTDNDGIANSIQHYTYGPLGKRVIYRNDQDADGMVDQVTESEYTAFNVQSSSRTDSNNDGVFDSGWRHEFDGFGQLILRESYGPGGTVTSSRTQRWDEEGALIYRERFSASRHTIEEWTFEEGLMTQYTKDSNADGTIDEIQTYGGVNLQSDYSTRSIDSNADGVIDKVEQRTTNAFGQVLTQAEDSENDGVFEKHTEYQYDSSGRLILREERDTAGLLTLRHTWTFGTDGLLVSAERDDNGDGQVNWRATYEATADGYAQAMNFDTDGDGSNEFTSTFTKTDFGQTARYEQDSDGDGVVDYTSDSYYEGLRKVRTEIDRDGDGLIDEVATQSDWLPVPLTAFL